MTVSYAELIPNANWGNNIRIFSIWRGSLLKGVWLKLLIYCLLYTAISATYRLILSSDEHVKQCFERFCVYCNTYQTFLPLEFILGFYISQVIGRWWLQFDAIVWPDKLALDLAAFLPGEGEQKQVRRQVVRLANLSVVMVLRSLSVSVAKRFPTFQHLVQAGLLTEKELQKMENLITVTENKHYTFYAPIMWAQATLRKARTEGLLTSDYLYYVLHKDLDDVRGTNGSLALLTWINIPLVYTQVVTIAVHAFFFSTLFGRQYLQPTHFLAGADGTYKQVEMFTPNAINLVGLTENYLDLYVPIFTLLQFIVYFGWLHVAEVLINPFGEDDEDFDCNFIIDRNVQINYLQVEGGEDGEELEDPYQGALPTSLPHTVESFKTRDPTPIFPTEDVIDQLTKEDMALHQEETPTGEEVSLTGSWLMGISNVRSNSLNHGNSPVIFMNSELEKIQEE